jgi:hypothetical protein
LIKIAVACVLIALTVACASGLKVDSLCILEPASGMCWVNKEKNIGTKISEMDSWFALNEVDLRKVVKKLNECEAKPLNETH